MPAVSDGYTWTFNGSCLGGIVGWTDLTNIILCANKENAQVIATGTTSGFSGSIGGIVGHCKKSTINKCYNEIAITDGERDMIGGIVGYTRIQSKIYNCYNKGSISGNEMIGGIVGLAERTDIRYCYNTNNVTAVNNVGGIVGLVEPQEAESLNDNYLYYCYNIGEINGNTNVGSVCGRAKYFTLYYLYSLSGISTNNIGTVLGITGSNYTSILDKQALIDAVLENCSGGFKSDTTNKNNGYPILSWQ